MKRKKKEGMPFTTYSLATAARMSHPVAITWCDKGLVKSWRTPGGHRRIERKDGIAFLASMNRPIDTFDDDVRAEVEAAR